MDFLNKMQDQNPCSFYSLDMNEQGQLRNVFWADSKSRSSYNYFGDVVAMNAKPPHSIITNYCHDVAIAIKKVFPNAQHRFCLSHILNGLPEKLEEMENKDEIISTFTTLACGYVTIPDFDREWQDTIQHFRLEGNEWLSKLYEVRMQWAPDLLFMLRTRFGQECLSQTEVIVYLTILMAG